MKNRPRVDQVKSTGIAFGPAYQIFLSFGYTIYLCTNLLKMQLPAGVDNAEIEERIIQHLAASMGRARHGTRREGHRSRSSTQGGHPQFMMFSPPPPFPPPMLSSPSQRDETDTVTNLRHNTVWEGSLHSNMQPPASSHPHQGSPSASDSNRSQYQPSFLLAYTGLLLLINLPKVIKIELDHPNSNHFQNL
ncbi:unnamed protein product [Eruca vesicaria subsp. sativa]|uniref:Uncharacterized protein n=1 Tax=Eruca vesicaria subsp. sativa TaxID=29727 RepID=A0ABC8M288_ERUVS|nr:unnamed protein product [Eruca vesicaria subsp. sativa]